MLKYGVWISIFFVVIAMFTCSSKSSNQNTNENVVENGCKYNFKDCVDNKQLMDTYEKIINAKSQCKRSVNDNVRFGEAKWSWGFFNRYVLTGDQYPKTGIIEMADFDVQIQNKYGAMEKSQVSCRYDLKSQQVLEVSINGNYTTISTVNEAVSESTPIPDKYIGKLPSDVVDDVSLNFQFKQLLGNSFEKFYKNISGVSSEVVLIGNYYFGAGCQAHSCGSEESAFVINKTNGQIVSLILSDGNKFSISGVNDIKELPKPLDDWFVEKGGLHSTAKKESNVKVSFDCSKAKSDAEILICNDVDLSKLDSELAVLYRDAKQKTKCPSCFKEETNNAWKYRESNCHDKDSLIKWYADRTKSLNAIIEEPAN